MKSNLGKNFNYYTSGQIVSSLGDVTAYMSLSWWVLQKTGSGLQFALILAPVAAIQIFLQPFLAPLADRFSRKIGMLVSDVLRMVTSLLAFLMIYFDYFSFPLLVGIACLGAVFTAIFESSVAGLTRILVAEENVPAAFQFQQVVNGVKGFLNPSVAGVLVSLLGPAFGTLLNVFTYGAALFCNFKLELPKFHRSSGSKEIRKIAKDWWFDLSAGFKSLLEVKVVMLSLVAIGIFQFMFSHISVTLPILVLKEHNLAPWSLGALEATIGIGVIIGGITAKWGHRAFVGRKLWVTAFLVSGLSMIVLGTTTSLYIAGFFLICMMSFQTWLNIQFQTRVSLAIPKEFQSRVFALIGLLTTGLLPLGFSVAGGLTEKFGAGYIISGSGFGALFLFPLILFIPRLKEFLSCPIDQVSTFIGKTYPKAFQTSKSSY